MKINFKSNLVSGIVSTIFAIALWLIIPIQCVDVSNKMIKSDFLPKMIAVIILVCGIWLIVQSVLKPDKEKIVTLDLKKEGRVAIYMAALIIYTLIFAKIGFLFSSLLLSLFTLAFVKEKRPVFYLIVIIYVTAIFFIFKYALGIPLPAMFLK